MGRKRRKRPADLVEACHGRWRVDIEPALEDVRRRWPQAAGGLARLGRELEGALNSDRSQIHRLLREAIIAEEEGVPIRRYRLSTPAGWLRLLFIVDLRGCRVVFTAAELRDEETYKRIRRKLKRGRR